MEGGWLRGEDGPRKAGAAALPTSRPEAFWTPALGAKLGSDPAVSGSSLSGRGRAPCGAAGPDSSLRQTHLGPWRSGEHPRCPLHLHLYPCAPPPALCPADPPAALLSAPTRGHWTLGLKVGGQGGGDEPQGSSSLVWNRPVHTMCSELRLWDTCPSPPGSAVRRPQAPGAHGKGSQWLQGPFEAGVDELAPGGLNHRRRGTSSTPGRRAADSSRRAVRGCRHRAPHPVPPAPVTEMRSACE